MSSDCNIPAFPQALCCNPDGTHVAPVDISPIYGGMSLRDYFAGQILPSLVHKDVALNLQEPVRERCYATPRDIAMEAYQYADALLDAREAKS